MPTRAKLKQAAKDCIKAQTLNPVLVTLVYALIAVVVSLLDGISAATVIIPLVLAIAFNAIQMGYTYYCMKIAKREQATYADLVYILKDWRFTLKLVGLTLVTSILIMLWSMLLVVPGVIKAFSYSQAFKVMIENPNMSITEAIKESKKLMDGHKMEYFILDLSFIPWTLLVGITCGIASLWALPYIQTTMVQYYYSLKQCK